MSLALPAHASLDYLKKVAKEWLATLRAKDPATKLADAQLAVARHYGFSSWRALKAEVERRRVPMVARFVQACTSGDVESLRQLLNEQPALARERVAGGTTGLHLAVRHPDAVRLLLEHGADPNARDIGDHAMPLHFAAASGAIETVRMLLDSGADVQGAGDLHHGDVIGWAARKGNEPVIDLLVERGARHHIFSAMALSDRAAVRRLVDDDRGSLLRRRSRFECGQTAVHAAFAPPDGLGFLCGKPDYAMLQLHVELGADLEATDDKGRTPLAVATLRGDREAMRLLEEAGAGLPARPDGARLMRGLTAAAGSIRRSSAMFRVPDMRGTIRWYESIGFKVHDRYENGGELVFARLSFGNAEFTLTPGRGPGPRDVSLWFFADRVDELYQLLKARQLRAVHAAKNGETVDAPDVRFEEDLYQPFYGGRQFSIRDINDLLLVFWQPAV